MSIVDQMTGLNTVLSRSLLFIIPNKEFHQIRPSSQPGGGFISCKYLPWENMCIPASPKYVSCLVHDSWCLSQFFWNLTFTFFSVDIYNNNFIHSFYFESRIGPLFALLVDYGQIKQLPHLNSFP